MTTRDMAAAHFWSMSSDREAVCTHVLPCAQEEVQGVAFNVQSLRYFWLLLHDHSGQDQWRIFVCQQQFWGWGFSKIYLWLNVTWTLVTRIFAVHSHVGRWNKYEWLLEKVFLTKSRNHMLFFHILFTIHLIHSFASKPTFKKQWSPLINSTSLLPFHSIIHWSFSTFTNTLKPALCHQWPIPFLFLLLLLCSTAPAHVGLSLSWNSLPPILLSHSGFPPMPLTISSSCLLVPYFCLLSKILLLSF